MAERDDDHLAAIEPTPQKIVQAVTYDIHDAAISLRNAAISLRRAGLLGRFPIQEPLGDFSPPRTIRGRHELALETYNQVLREFMRLSNLVDDIDRASPVPELTIDARAALDAICEQLTTDLAICQILHEGPAGKLQATKQMRVAMRRACRLFEGPLLLAAAKMRAMSNGGIQPAWSRVLSPNERALIFDSDWKTIKKSITAGKLLGKKLSDNTQNRPNSQWNDVLELLTTSVIVAWAGFVSYWLVFMNFANGDPLLASINLIQLPFSIMFMAYPLSFVVGAISSFFYPSKMFAENSKYYSAVPQQKTEDTPWPPVTIQIPVYNEKFEDAIQLTLESAMRARGNYIEKGGAANIIVNDDGIMMFLKNDLGAFDRLMALVRAGGTDEGLQRDEREAFLRLKYYTENGIGFTARPTQNRLGKFKKAGNMNYGMIQLSEVVDDLLAEDGKQVYDEVLMRVSRRLSPPAAASGDIQFGKFIVLLDADSRMHPDIIAMTIPEFLSDPALGFTQHPNLPFNGDENYFSRAIARFTENLYHIVFAVISRGGFPPPLTGHGVFLNVEAMKKIAFKDEDGLKKYWNEKRVSEDFDMSMALQSLGYIGRYIDFAGYEFAEGVSRNFDEEVKKLSKFGCGASEMIFHPIRDWFRKGILTPQIKQYLTSDTPLSAKTSMMKYLFSYFGIASVFVMFPMQLLLIATGYEWNTVIVSSLMLSYQNTVIFAVIGPLSSLILRWKLNQNSIYRERDGTAWNQVKTEAQLMPVFSLLFIGAMFMIFKGVASHLLGLDIRWGATNKDKLEDRNFRDSVREVFSSSGQQIRLGSVAFASIVTAYLWMPTSFTWHIFFGPTVLAAGHVIAPFLLNPAFMANFSKKQAKPSFTDSVGARLAEEAKPKLFFGKRIAGKHSLSFDGRIDEADRSEQPISRNRSPGKACHRATGKEV